MSYGNYSVYRDLNRGMTVKQVSRNIQERYPDIGSFKAMRIVKQIKKEGPDIAVKW